MHRTAPRGRAQNARSLSLILNALGRARADPPRRPALRIPTLLRVYERSKTLARCQNFRVHPRKMLVTRGLPPVLKICRLSRVPLFFTTTPPAILWGGLFLTRRLRPNWGGQKLCLGKSQGALAPPTRVGCVNTTRPLTSPVLTRCSSFSIRRGIPRNLSRRHYSPEYRFGFHSAHS